MTNQSKHNRSPFNTIEHNQAIEDIRYSMPEIELRGLKKGHKCQPILLCLHGWLDNAASFVPLMTELNDYQIIAIDWPGHGHSAHRSQDAHYHFIDYVYDLVLLFEFNQWQSVDIVAHSMGGMIASAFAAAFPEKVKSLTLIDSIGFISAKSAETTQQLRKGMLSRLKLKSKRKPLHGDLESAITARRSVSDLSYQDAKLIVERGCITLDKGITWRSDSRLRNTSPYRLTFSQAKQFIQDITTPVQLIYGDKGIELVELGLEHFAPLFKCFTAHKLTGGHHIHMEQAKKTAVFIESFIENQDDH
ncbi:MULTISPECIES: alpha/beta hydrolase [Thalassotalea]|uniref:Alpha/beta hydrolase n=1 Tax=Thalassotalea castellviae TaxID=3075612 RepID=A0ABU2ZXN4_9GAMM|nr:alpha/beta hydrolase [Thalassotalea sp. W431]MDT0602445.1 alpha/beta hydrolase [Thalassotalea sp. W431]